MEFADAFPIITDYKGCDLVGDRNEGVRAWERIHLELLLQLKLEFRLLLECLLRSKSIGRLMGDEVLLLVEEG